MGFAALNPSCWLALLRFCYVPLESDGPGLRQIQPLLSKRKQLPPCRLNQCAVQSRPYGVEALPESVIGRSNSFVQHGLERADECLCP